MQVLRTNPAVTFKGIKSLCRSFRSSQKQAQFPIYCSSSILLYNVSSNNQKHLDPILNTLEAKPCQNNSKTSSHEKCLKILVTTNHNSNIENSSKDQNTWTKEGSTCRLVMLLFFKYKKNQHKSLTIILSNNAMISLSDRGFGAKSSASRDVDDQSVECDCFICGRGGLSFLLPGILILANLSSWKQKRYTVSHTVSTLWNP